MLLLISLCYCGLIWLLFMKLKVLPWNKTSQGLAALVGVALIVGILILLAALGFSVLARAAAMWVS